jgi:hypothetical protein
MAVGHDAILPLEDASLTGEWTWGKSKLGKTVPGRMIDLPRVGVLRRKPDFIALADRARNTGQWELAAQIYRKALDRNPLSPSIWVQYGHALKESGELQDPDKLTQAEVAYRRALSLDPGAADTYLQLGHVLKLQGKSEEAQAAYLRAVALDPSLPHPPDELRGLGWSEAQIAELRVLGATTTQRSDPARPNGLADDDLERDVRTIRESGLFDEAYYRANDPQLPSDIDLVRHFLERGSREGRMPNRMFDSKSYLNQNPELVQSGTNPLVHFIQHYKFDPEFYLSRYPDVARSGQDPLEHFLKHGMTEGREPNAVGQPRDGRKQTSEFTAVTDAEIHCLKKPLLCDEVALFVAHSRNGRLKPHVSHYLNSLRCQGIAVVLIVAADSRLWPPTL